MNLIYNTHKTAECVYDYAILQSDSIIYKSHINL